MSTLLAYALRLVTLFLNPNLKLGKQDCLEGNPNPKTRTNPGHDCKPDLSFCYVY